MKRLWLFLMAVLLLGQGSYAAAGAYCLHEGERSAAAAHWGHHVHAHGDQDKAKGSPDGKASFDGDCAFCHAGSAFSPVAVAAIDLGARAPSPSAASPPHLASRSPDAPERPQWRAPALA